MALAFPKTNVVALAPIGAAGLFWAWFGLSPKAAFWSGWLAGTAFFAINFAWFGETAGALIAPFGFFLSLGPAVADALFGFALPGALTAIAARALVHPDRRVRALVPLASAAAFTACEWLRCEGLGPLGVPFASLGYAQIESPLAPVAAFAGTYGITLVVCIAGAYAAYVTRMHAVRGAGTDAALAIAAVGVCVALASAFDPAREAAAPALRVAAIQGNIAQAVKFTPAAFALAVSRYEDLTLRAAHDRPALVVWPETVMTTPLNANPLLAARLSRLASLAHTTLVVGTLEVIGKTDYNVLYVYGPDGALETVYRKRRLVPFAERLPFAPLLHAIPWTRNVSNFSAGTQDGIFSAGGARVAPVICWESDFSGLVRGDVRAGASLIAVATDDAWFGATAGPYMHAQAAQMRARESGRWIVRAASTGISGIVAPDGRFTRASALGVATFVGGAVGTPVATPFARVGAERLTVLYAIAYVAIVAFGRTARRRFS